METNKTTNNNQNTTTNEAIPEVDVEINNGLAWLKEEEAQCSTQKEFEKYPALKLEDRKMVEIDIDFSKPFEKWNTTDSKGKQVTKAIIPVMHNGERKTFWLNIKNPIYRDIIRGGRVSNTRFKILRTGQQQDTKFVIVE